MVSEVKKKRLLILSHKSPYAPLDGGVIAIRNFFEALCDHPSFSVFMLCLETNKHPHKEVPTQYENKINSFFIDTDLKKKEALKSLVKGESYNLNRFYSQQISDQVKNHIEINTYDFVLFESLFSTVYLHDIKSVFNGKLLYRSHNIEHHIWEKLAQKESNFIKKIYLQKLAKDLKVYELNIHNKFDAIFPISKTDLEYYRSIINANIPINLLYFIRENIERKEDLNQNHFFHLASMDWQPNLQAVQWFVNRVWKPLYENNPMLVLHLAGKSMPKEYFNMKEWGIRAYDYIEDGDTFMQSKGTLLVPLFSGSGIRIKVVDALCLGVPLISTKLGVSGIDLEAGVHYLKAETEEDFKTQVLKISKKEINSLDMVKKSKIFAKQNFQVESVISVFENQLNKL